MNDEVYYHQYTQWPEEFDVTKINAKLTWLSSIQGQKVMFKNESNWCQDEVIVKEKKVFKRVLFPLNTLFAAGLAGRIYW